MDEPDSQTKTQWSLSIADALKKVSCVLQTQVSSFRYG